MKFIALSTAALLVALGATAAQAQATRMLPNGSGGYNIYEPGQAGATKVLPNGSGGYYIYEPGQAGATRMLPNGSGGYNVYEPPTAPPSYDESSPSYEGDEGESEE
ncbi:MAG: hypothetical protein JO121_03815 [Deltaproteobacteria bacterium]|nr:hypothetical protein [Deltaproteobacteria bacterium]